MFAPILVALFVLMAAAPPKGGWPIPPKTSTVKSVYDGDTVTLATGDKIRLRWVNTPELRPLEAYGIEAREATVRFVQNQKIRLIMASENPRDTYGRVLAGIETDDGDLSLHLIEVGVAHLFIIPPDETELKPFIAAQSKARAANRGIWSTDRYRGTMHITSFHANAAGDDYQNVNGEYLRVCNITPEPVNLDGYRITDISDKSWTLPAIVIPAGHTVKIHSGHGEHQKNAAKQLEIYLGSSTPIWNNKRDKAVLYDRFGRIVDSVVHEVQKAVP
jgi:micrococcal nuclease